MSAHSGPGLQTTTTSELAAGAASSAKTLTAFSARATSDLASAGATVDQVAQSATTPLAQSAGFLSHTVAALSDALQMIGANPVQALLHPISTALKVVGSVVNGLLTDIGLVQPAHSPLDTPDQRAIDATAEQLMQTPELQALVGQMKQTWHDELAAQLAKTGQTIDPATEARLDQAAEEWVRGYAQKAANADPTNPKVMWFEDPPHTWSDGTSVPGGRYGADGQDTIYGYIPMNNQSTYVLTGKYTDGDAPVNTRFQVTGDPHDISNLNNFYSQDMVTNPDGTWTLTLGPGASCASCTNYLQLPPGTQHLNIRQTLSDWNTQVPAEMTVTRISGPPANATPPTQAQMVASTIAMVKQLDWMKFYVIPYHLAQGVNKISPTYGCGGQGDQSCGNGTRAFGNFNLAPDQAMVITMPTGGAQYVSAQIFDLWTVSPDYWQAQTGLNNQQAKPNADGTYTFVISAKDPGVYNWIDTAGLSQGTVFLRWQYPPVDPQGPPETTYQVVNIADLPSVLPPDTARANSWQRYIQLQQRKQGFDRSRLGEGLQPNFLTWLGNQAAALGL